MSGTAQSIIDSGVFQGVVSLIDCAVPDTHGFPWLINESLEYYNRKEIQVVSFGEKRPIEILDIWGRGDERIRNMIGEVGSA